MLRRLLVCALVAASAVAGSWALADEADLKIGDAAPKWEGLAGVDEQEHSLADLKGKKAVAVVFTCNNCPVAVAYEDRLKEFAKDYQERGVAVVAINVNAGEDLAAMKERAKEKEFNFPYVYDESQETAKNYGATCTPHVFLLDKDRKVAYMGSIDDNLDDPKEHFLRAAADAVLAGKAVEKNVTKQFGCGIKYK